MGAWELISDTSVSSNVTFVEISGLSISKDDELMLVCELLPGSSASSYQLWVNGNDTQTNYYSQEEFASDTTISAAKNNNSVFSYSTANNSSKSIVNIKLTQNEYFMYQSDNMQVDGANVTIDNFYGISTFTMTSITSLKINASLASGIQAGSRIQLYKRIAIVEADILVSSDSSTVALTGLAIGKDNEYRLIITSLAPALSTLSMFINGNLSTTNYYSQYLRARGTAFLAGRIQEPAITYMTTGDDSIVIVDIKLTSAGYCTWQAKSLISYDDPSGSLFTKYDVYGSSTFTMTEITSITIGSIGAIDTGSRIQLIKMK